MEAQSIFRRIELKYLLTDTQRAQLERVMKRYMEPDPFPHSSIRNLYYDTDTWLLVRNSIERPVYKEKLRLRSYGPAGADDRIFAELKKKYDSVVYKRRITLPAASAMDWLAGGVQPESTQIAREITFFRDHYQGIRPAMFLSYERDSWRAKDGSDFRLTIDREILAREEGLDLSEPTGGAALLSYGTCLMELKTSGALPLWMARFLSENHIYKTSYSKYGTAYRLLVQPRVFCRASAPAPISYIGSIEKAVGGTY